MFSKSHQIVARLALIGNTFCFKFPCMQMTYSYFWVSHSKLHHSQKYLCLQFYSALEALKWMSFIKTKMLQYPYYDPLLRAITLLLFHYGNFPQATASSCENIFTAKMTTKLSLGKLFHPHQKYCLATRTVRIKWSFLFLFCFFQLPFKKLHLVY